MSQLAQATLDIRVEADCSPDGCETLAQNMLDVLDTGRYDLCSVLIIPADITGWLEAHRTARKRAARAIRAGYRFSAVARHEHADDIFAINTSLPERQGRPMTSGYHERPSETPLPVYPCERHAIRTYGVLQDDTLVAYLWLYRAGDLALVSSILGHADHLGAGVMFLLFAGMLDAEIKCGPGSIVYNRHDSGQDGLRWFKERLGLEERAVQWCR